MMPSDHVLHARADLPSAVRSRSLLLPNLRNLAIIQLLALMLPRTSWMVYLVPLVCIVSLTYAAWVLLKTLDLAQRPYLLSLRDRQLFKWSGPLACLAALVSVAILISMNVAGSRPRWFEPLVHDGLTFIVETAAVMSLACVCARRSTGHVPPRWIWRALCLPILIACTSLLPFMLIGPFAQVMGFN